MKTTSYNTEKEIRIGVLVVIFTISIFTAVRVQELQLSDATNQHETRYNQIVNRYDNFSSLTFPDAVLVKEPVLEVENWMNSNNYWGVKTKNEIPATKEVAESELALEIESWMTNNNYWNGTSEAETAESEPALEIESWMTTSSYFTGTNIVEAVEAEPTLEIESWMSNSNYWSGNTEGNEKELTLDIESWMNSGTYWTGSEEPIKSGNNLANN